MQPKTPAVATGAAVETAAKPAATGAATTGGAATPVATGAATTGGAAEKDAESKNYTRELLIAGGALALAALSLGLKFSETINLQTSIIIACVAVLVGLVAAVLGVYKYISEPEVKAAGPTVTSLTTAPVTQVNAQDPTELGK